MNLIKGKGLYTLLFQCQFDLVETINKFEFKMKCSFNNFIEIPIKTKPQISQTSKIP